MYCVLDTHVEFWSEFWRYVHWRDAVPERVLTDRVSTHADEARGAASDPMGRAAAGGALRRRRRSPASHLRSRDAAGTHVLVCQYRGGVPRRRAPRQPADRIAPAPARRVRELPARRPLSSTSAPAVDHAAALWQLCCRIGRTTTVACQRVGSYARCHHLRPQATGSILVTNSRATQRAGELAAADPAYRARRPSHRACGRS